MNKVLCFPHRILSLGRDWGGPVGSGNLGIGAKIAAEHCLREDNDLRLWLYGIGSQVGYQLFVLRGHFEFFIDLG